MGSLDRLFGGNGAATAAQTPPPPPPSAAAAMPERAAPLTDPIAMIEEDAAEGEIKEIYEEVKRALQVPMVPNIDKMLANAPNALRAMMALAGEMYIGSTLPQPVVSMVLYSIASASHCNYCGSWHQLTCRTIGIDEDTLAALAGNLGAVTPERVQAIVAFAVKAAKTPGAVGQADYDGLRAQGISDAEIVEIVGLAATGAFLDIVSDALKIPVDDMIKQGLAQATA